MRNLRVETIEREARASLDRLQTDRIDLYYAHFDDEDAPLEETLRDFDGFVRAGTVRAIGRPGVRAHAAAGRRRVQAPIASARTVEQLEQLLSAATLELTPQELDRLSATTR